MVQDLTVIVLAAGGGTRMKSKTMKVLHHVSGRSMVGHVLGAVQALSPQRVVAVVGTQREQVGAHIEDVHPGIVLAVQETQEGTGHAVRVGWEAVPADQHTGTVLVAYGDTPLLEPESLQQFVDQHAASPAAVSILSGILEDPFGYGRIIRNAEGGVERIVEQKDATDNEAAVREINSGILAFDAEFLDVVLPLLSNENASGEYYLTDTVGLAREHGKTVEAFVIDDISQVEGANDRVQLAQMGREKNRRILEEWMREGVTIMDPATTWIDVDATLDADVTLLPGVQLLGACVIAEDAVIGPDTTLKDCEVGRGARVVRAHGELATIGPEANVGPFSYLRPGTQVGASGKVGAFVEVKNSQIGEGAKVPHLSYVGDAEIGDGSNIGAGTIFANYDGVNKHRTAVGKHARTGSNNTFVAPVTIGDGAGTGAGAVVREDIPAGSLGLSAGPQRNIDGWTRRRRPGTDQARAAEDSTQSAEGDSTAPPTE